MISICFESASAYKTFDYTKSIIVISEDKIQIKSGSDYPGVWKLNFNLCSSVSVKNVKNLADQLKRPLITSNS